MKDYDSIINYHLRKVNVVANALSRKSVATIQVIQLPILKDLYELGLEIILKG